MAKKKLSHLQETKKSDQQLGTLIAEVLAHPDTPEKVYNGIVDALNDIQSRADVHGRAEYIQAVIDCANLKEKPKGGAQ